MQADRQKGYRRILAVRMDNIGDIVLLGPPLRSVRKAFPGASITLLSSPAGSTIAPLLPWVDRVIPWKALWQDVSGSQEFQPDRELELVHTLKAGNFDLALIFTSFAQSPYPPAYACFLAGIPIRAGLSKEFGGGVLTHWAKSPPDEIHQVDRNLAVIKSLGIPTDGEQLELSIDNALTDQVKDLLISVGIQPGEPFIGLAPGASCNARRYPVDKFAKVAEIVANQARLPVVILGSQREAAGLGPFEEILAPRQIISLVGKTTVPGFVGVIQQAAFILANNSSALHIADAFGKPMVIFYSGTEYRSQWMPRNSPAILLNRETKCSPCYRFECLYQGECLQFRPEEAAEVILDFIKTTVDLPAVPGRL